MALQSRPLWFLYYNEDKRTVFQMKGNSLIYGTTEPTWELVTVCRFSLWLLMLKTLEWFKRWHKWFVIQQFILVDLLRVQVLNKYYHIHSVKTNRFNSDPTDKLMVEPRPSAEISNQKLHRGLRRKNPCVHRKNLETSLRKAPGQEGILLPTCWKVMALTTATLCCLCCVTFFVLLNANKL